MHQCRSFFDTPEEIFTTGHISHAGQAIGMIVAETEAIARKAVKAVKITYKNHKEPILVSFEANLKKYNDTMTVEIILHFFG
jgi:xanthine dehydrogenase molybdopterin-binding subunit B